MASSASAVTCNRVPLTAPTQSTIQLFSTAPSVPLNGSVDLIATITEQAGTPVPDGTLVSFTTTLGRIEPSETRTNNGKATVKLVAGTQSGTATVTAFSGAATGGTGDNATAGASIEVAIGAAAAETVAVRAEPASVPPSGGSILIIAQVLDESGNLLSGLPVTFTTTAGQLSSSSAVSDANGEARVTLSTSTAATVTARAGSATDDVEVAVGTVPTIALTATPDAPTVGEPVTFGITITVPEGGSPVKSVRIEFGDGDSANLGAVSGQTSATHTYDSDGTRTVRVTVTDTANQTTSGAIVISVQPSAPVNVTLDFSPAAPSVNQSVTFTATVTPATVTPEKFDWEFGDGTTRTTTGNETIKAYTSAGTKKAKVTVTATDGSKGTAAADVVVGP
jgi:PKD repeat protein